MKKILAILAVMATAFSLVSCKMQNNKTTAELVSEAEAKQSMLVESSIQAETKRLEEIDKKIKIIGKSERKKQLVIKKREEHYQVFVMNRKDVCNKVIDYYFFDDIEAYNIKSQKPKVEGRQKLIDKDPDARMVAFESECDYEGMNTYDQLYELFSSPSFVAEGFEIIE